jgi:hypothetical protein
LAVTLNLKPETQAGLLALARLTGMTLEEYLLSVVEGVVISRSGHSLTPARRVAAWRETAKRFPDTPLLCIPIADR